MAMPGNGSRPGYPAQGGREGRIAHVPPRQAIRVGDMERDAAAQELGDHFAAGRLTLEELHERLGLVLSARTRGELTGVMADLPTPRQPASRQAAPRELRLPEPEPGERSRAAWNRDQEHERSGDTAGRLAAVGLILVAMLIWLVTALLFAHHGYGYGYGHPYPTGNWQQ